MVVAAALQERGGPHALVGGHGGPEMGDRVVPAAQPGPQRADPDLAPPPIGPGLGRPATADNHSGWAVTRARSASAAGRDSSRR